MKTVSVRDLRYDFPKVERLLREGKDLQVTKRKRVIARLVPEPVAVPAKLPDFKARMKKIFGDKVLKVSGAELIAQERDRY
jgi:antitoxin (DNA-binding transcriptional repressor) of toxin-antitoxin stability system